MVRLTPAEKAERREATRKRYMELYRVVVPKAEWSGAGEHEKQDFTPRFQLRRPGWLGQGCRRVLPMFPCDDDWRAVDRFEP